MPVLLAPVANAVAAGPDASCWRSAATPAPARRAAAEGGGGGGRDMVADAAGEVAGLYCGAPRGGTGVGCWGCGRGGCEDGGRGV